MHLHQGKWSSLSQQTNINFFVINKTLCISLFLFLLPSGSFPLIPPTLSLSPLFFPHAAFITPQRPLHFFMLSEQRPLLTSSVDCQWLALQPVWRANVIKQERVCVCVWVCVYVCVCVGLFYLHMPKCLLQDEVKGYVSLKWSEWQHLYFYSVHGGKKMQ